MTHLLIQRNIRFQLGFTEERSTVKWKCKLFNNNKKNYRKCLKSKKIIPKKILFCGWKKLVGLKFVKWFEFIFASQRKVEGFFLFNRIPNQIQFYLKKVNPKCYMHFQILPCYIHFSAESDHSLI